MVIKLTLSFDMCLRIDRVIFNVTFHIHPDRYIIISASRHHILAARWLFLDGPDFEIAQLYVDVLRSIDDRFVLASWDLLLIILW